MSTKIKFLTLKKVLRIHKKMIDLHGGAHGVRDTKLLDSALNQPQVTFSGQYIHDSISKMAAAYAFHIIKNHAFVDGNKRTGLLSASIFLESNAYELRLSQTEFYKLAIDVASSKISKQELATIISKNIRPISKQ